MRVLHLEGKFTTLVHAGDGFNFVTVRAYDTPGLFLGRGQLRRTGLFQKGQLLLRRVQAGEASRPEKDHRVLDALFAEATERLRIFGKDAQRAPVRAMQE